MLECVYFYQINKTTLRKFSHPSKVLYNQISAYIQIKLYKHKKEVPESRKLECVRVKQHEMCFTGLFLKALGTLKQCHDEVCCQ